MLDEKKDFQSECRLPIVLQTEMNTVLYQALPICVILAYPSLRSWYYENFIEIYYTNYYTVRGDYQYVGNNFRFPAICYSYVFNLHDQYDYVENDEICNQITNAITQGYYSYIQLNEFYLSTQGSYQLRNFLHDSLIYGYNVIRKVFYGITIDAKRVFNTVEISFEELEIAYNNGLGMSILGESALNNHSLDRSSHLTFFKVNQKATPYEFRLSVFNERLHNYINACKNYEFEYYFHQNPAKIIYGTDIYYELIDYYKTKREITFQDFRNFHFLYEHKKGLIKRLYYIAEHFAVTKRYLNLIKRFNTIKEAMDRIRMIMLKQLYMLAKQTKDEQISSILEVVSRDERHLLYEIYRELFSLENNSASHSINYRHNIVSEAKIQQITIREKEEIAKKLSNQVGVSMIDDYQIVRLKWKKKYFINCIHIYCDCPTILITPNGLFEPLLETRKDNPRDFIYKNPIAIRSLYVLLKTESCDMNRFKIAVIEKGLAIGASIRASSTYQNEEGFNDPNSIAENAVDGRNDTFWNAAAGKGRGEYLEINFSKPVNFNEIVIQQRLMFDRITGYSLMYAGETDQWIEIFKYQGNKIGHEDLNHKFKTLEAKRIRLLITDTEPDHLGYFEAAISKFEVYKI